MSLTVEIPNQVTIWTPSVEALALAWFCTGAGMGLEYYVNEAGADDGLTELLQACFVFGLVAPLIIMADIHDILIECEIYE